MKFKRHELSEVPIEVGPRFSSQKTVYAFFEKNTNTLVMSEDPKALIDEARLFVDLKVSNRAISFFLQSGVIPSPCFMFEEIFSVGPGWLMKVWLEKGNLFSELVRVKVFENSSRGDVEDFDRHCEDKLLSLLRGAVVDGINPDARSFLFLSAGKDSSSIALALSGASVGKVFECVTYKAKGEADESEIAAEIAKKLGFRHRTLLLSEKLTENQKSEIERYFAELPMPCSDNATILYPLVKLELDLHCGENVIDGMGNDIYLGHVPGRREYQLQAVRRLLPIPGTLERYLESESKFRKVCRSRPEITGLYGLTYGDERLIRQGAEITSDHWSALDCGEDYLDLRARVRGAIIDHNVFMNKVRGLSFAYGCNVIFPWEDSAVAEYAFGFTEQAMFDRKNLKNKVFLRKMLKDRIGLDSDALGKKQFEFRGWGIVRNNKDWAFEQILSCRFWSKKEVESLLSRLAKKSDHDEMSQSLIYRLFIFSLWANNSKYLSCKVA